MSELRAPLLIGIDLGTTHTALSYCSPGNDPSEPPVDWPVPQLVAPGQIEARLLLPSALYLPSANERNKGIIGPEWMPSDAPIIGAFALEHGQSNPSRLVTSAKSWLCHSGIDRTAPVLPWDATDETGRVSPIDAVHWILRHLSSAWNHTMAAEDSSLELAQQEIFITVPASFDAVARQLTVEAAEAAGLTKTTLLEEPQAAFYAWLAQEGDQWREQISVGDRILVCDLGGGTTDLTMVEVQDRLGNLELHRIAVGDHLLLGGDNMDLALSYHVQSELEQKQKIRLTALQKTSLQLSCRRAKEKLLADPAPEEATITLLGTGSSVIGGTRTFTLHRQVVEDIVIDGFFPITPPDEFPADDQSFGLHEFGLPFVSDPSISRHLAQFLSNTSRKSTDDQAGIANRMPAAILFNGGVFNASALRRRLLDLFRHWREHDREAPQAPPVRSLDEKRTDLAVARGAAYFGLVRHGKGVRIRAGAGRTYYLGIKAAAPAVPGVPPRKKAVSIIPFGTEEGTTVRLNQPEFGLLIGKKASFELLSSTTRRSDPPGTVLDSGDLLDALELTAPLQATLEPSESHPAGTIVPVHLECTPTEIGTLDLQCVDREGKNRWKLEFDLRARKES
jgi:molecular chaperone DnaK (HSP70)